MAGKFTVDLEELSRTASFLKDAAASYQRISVQLMDRATHMGAAYDSDDNRASVTQIQGCTSDLRMMAQRLNDTADMLMQQRHNYEERMEGNIAAVRRL